jgi:hypothetical protein
VLFAAAAAYLRLSGEEFSGSGLGFAIRHSLIWASKSLNNKQLTRAARYGDRRDRRKKSKPIGKQTFHGDIVGVVDRRAGEATLGKNIRLIARRSS